MNWYKQKIGQAENWGQNKLYHLINIISLQINQFDGLIFDPASAQLNPTSNIFTIIVDTEQNIKYIVNGRQINDKLDTTIRTDYDQFVGSYSYSFSKDQPYTVATGILTNIYNHMNASLK